MIFLTVRARTRQDRKSLLPARLAMAGSDLAQEHRRAAHASSNVRRLRVFTVEKFCFKAAVGVIEPHLTLISLAGLFFASRAQVKANRRVFESEIFTQLMN